MYSQGGAPFPALIGKSHSCQELSFTKAVPWAQHQDRKRSQRRACGCPDRSPSALSLLAGLLASALCPLAARSWTCDGQRPDGFFGLFFPCSHILSQRRLCPSCVLESRLLIAGGHGCAGLGTARQGQQQRRSFLFLQRRAVAVGAMHGGNACRASSQEGCSRFFFPCKRNCGTEL